MRQEQNANRGRWFDRRKTKARRKLRAEIRSLPGQRIESAENNYYRAPLDAAGLAWAEQRLKELGFSISVDGKVRSYTLDRETFTVYADEIDFTVFRRPLPKPSRRRRVRFFPHFKILDSWKNDLRTKFEKRLAEAVNLAKQRRF